MDDSKVFTISVLSEKTTMTFIGTFGFKCGRNIDKFEGINHKLGKTKTPIILDYSVASIEAEIINKIDVGTHTIFIGKIIDSEVQFHFLTNKFFISVENLFIPYRLRWSPSP